MSIGHIGAEKCTRAVLPLGVARKHAIVSVFTVGFCETVHRGGVSLLHISVKLCIVLFDAEMINAVDRELKDKFGNAAYSRPGHPSSRQGVGALRAGRRLG